MPTMTMFPGVARAGVTALLWFCASGWLGAKPLDLWISSYQDKVYYEEMVKRYRETQDKKFAANVHAFGFREMPDKLAVAIKTGVNPPDIVQLDEILFGMYLGGEVPFVDLTERVKEAKLDRDILPQRLGLFSHRGRTYGLPQSLSAMLLYYRADTMTRHGLSPDDLASWDDFVRAGERLAKSGQAMLGLDPSYFEILLRQRGSDWFGKDGQAFPDPKLAAETMRFLIDLEKKGIGRTPDRASIFDPVFFSGDIANEEVFCVIGADWYGLDMIQQFSSDLKGKWGVMALPAWRNKDGSYGRRTSTFAGQGLLIYRESKEIEAAWKFIRWVMTDLEANVQRFQQGNSFPAYRPAWKDERLLQPNAFFGDEPLGELLVSVAPDVPAVVMSPQRPKAVFLFQESFFSQVMYQQITPEQAVEQMKAILEKD